MNLGEQRPVREETKQRARAGGTALESIAGAAAVVLAVLGLADVSPVLMAGVACICVGASMLFEGLAIGARFYGRDLRQTENELEVGEVGIEALTGLTGVVLGVLSLADAVSPFTLLPIAALVMGGGLIFGTGAVAESARTRVAGESVSDMVRTATSSASAAHAFAGIAAVVLGILALLNIGIIALSLVAFLVIGATLVLSSAALGGRMLALLRR